MCYSVLEDPWKKEEASSADSEYELLRSLPYERIWKLVNDYISDTKDTCIAIFLISIVY